MLIPTKFNPAQHNMITALQYHCEKDDNSWIVPHYYFSGELFNISECYRLSFRYIVSLFSIYYYGKADTSGICQSSNWWVSDFFRASSGWIPAVSTCLASNNCQNIHQVFSVGLYYKYTEYGKRILQPSWRSGWHFLFVRSTSLCHSLVFFIVLFLF